MAVGCLFAASGALAPLLALAVPAASFSPAAAAALPLLQSVLLLGSLRAWRRGFARPDLDAVLDWCVGMGVRAPAPPWAEVEACEGCSVGGHRLVCVHARA